MCQNGIVGNGLCRPFNNKDKSRVVNEGLTQDGSKLSFLHVSNQKSRMIAH